MCFLMLVHSSVKQLISKLTYLMQFFVSLYMTMYSCTVSAKSYQIEDSGIHPLNGLMVEYGSH